MNLPFAHVGATFAPLELLPLLVAAVLYAKRSLDPGRRGPAGAALAPALLRRRAAD